MSSSLTILCPGQGAQVVGMGKDYADQSPAAREVFRVAGEVLGMDLAAICFGGPEQRLNQTDVSQPAIYTTSVACFRAACEAGLVQADQVTAYAGLSLGEYTALHLAGVFGFEQGLRLVAARGKAMQAAAVAVPSGMVAIMGADEAAVGALCAQAALGEVLTPANYNAPGQIVVSGAAGACRRVQEEAEAAGFKAAALKVAGAFHSPIMQPAADRMRAKFERVSFASPQRTVYANVTARPHTDGEQIKRLLVEQIVAPVRWAQTMQELIAAAGEGGRYVELAPGRTLAGLAKRISRRLPVESLATADALDGAARTGART
jgi:[acyl-carrier-protein] S-malonyltransferase